MPELSLAAWALLALAVAIAGVSKSAIPGSVSVSVAIFAAVLPAKESTGAMLAILILGDVGAIWVYRKTVSWSTLIRLIPTVLLGLGLGVGFLAITTDQQVAIAIGIILLGIISLAMYQRVNARPSRSAVDAAERAPSPRPRATPERQGPAPGNSRWKGRGERLIYGAAGGFTTMVANAAGPVMSMYFLASRLPMRTFLGTAAWFFGVVNLIKLPFSVGLGLITPESLRMNLVLVPALIAGFVAGRLLVRRMNQALFERLVIVFTVLGAAYLLAHGFLLV